MKTKATCFRVLFFAILFTIIGKVGNAQTFNCYVTNDHLVSPTVYEFDVWLEPTSTDFYMRSIQMGFQFNSAFFAAGSTISPAYDNSVSQLQVPFSSGPPQWNSTVFCLSVPSSSVAPCSGAPSTASGHTFFSAATGAKRVVRLRLTSTLPFNCASPQITMVRPLDPSPALGVLKMAVSSWGATCTAVTINNNGTYTNFAAQSLYSNVSNLNNLTVSATSPSSAQMCSGSGQATFSATATGNGSSTAVSYQWLLDGSPLVNDGTYQGVNTASLTVTNPTSGGQISVQVSQCSPTTPTPTSAPATLTVFNADDGNACTTDACDPATGTVTHLPVNVDDGNACTNDACNPQTGISHLPFSVDDGNACTTDGCDPITGPFHNPINVSDANLCDIESCDPATGNVTHTNVNIDDQNACTADACDPSTGVISHNTISVDDGNACTTDACNPASGPTHTPVNTDDGNACTTDACDPSTGVSHTPVSVTDGNACTTDACDPATGNISHTNVNIDDQNACTADACDPSTGAISHNTISVDDGNACTVDGCLPASGPTHTPLNVDDANACTVDGCDPATGATHTPLNVDDGNACTVDGCNPATGATHTALNVNDNNACTTDGCDPATGATHTPVSTNDNNVCTTDACDPITGVSHTQVTITDNDLCTTDACDPITGVSHTPINTNDGNACTVDGCNPATGATHTPLNVDDGNACTTDGCVPATGPTHTPINTNDGNACTVDGCDPATGATHTPLNVDDGNACTTDGCVPATGATHTPINTNDNDACTVDGCDPATGATHTPLNVDDGNGCTTDGCNPATGATHTPVSVTDGNACTTDACDPASGNITHTPVSVDDLNPCTADACDPITGISHTPTTVPDGNPCTIDGCNPQTGVPFYIPVPVTDNDACTFDACDISTGAISHTPVIISDDNLCTTDACDPVTGVSHIPVNINDQNACTVDACDPVTGVSHTPLNVDDQNPCTIDGCDPATGATHTPVFTASATSTPAGCNTGGTAHAEPSGNYSYLWSNNETTQDISNLVAGPYTVTVTDIQTGCTSTASTTVGSSGGGSSTTPGPITGPTLVCAGQRSVVYCVDPIPGATSYQWTLPNGAIGTSTGPCITIRFSSRWHGGQICVRTISTCGTSNPSCLTIIRVNSKPATPGPITGPIVLCPGSSSDYSILPVANATSYEWVVTGGLIINSGQGTTMINVTAPAGFVSGQIKVRAVNCKGKSGYRVITVTGLPPVLTWDFDDHHDNRTVGVCGGSTYHYDTHQAGIGCRLWTAPPGAIIYNPTTNTSGNPLQVMSNTTDGVYITFPPGFISGVVTVSSCNSCGTSAPITLNVRSTPAPPASISGPTTGVCNTSNNIYTIASVPGATSYTWTVPAGAQLTSTSNGGKTAKVKFLNSFVSGDVCVTANNTCGQSSPTCLTVFAVPSSPGPISGNSSVCKSNTNVQYSVASVSGTTSYNWTATNGVIITSGQGTRTIRVKFTAAIAPSTILTVSTVNGCGQSAATIKTVNINLSCKLADGDVSEVAIEGNSLNAFPNPTSGKATITFTANRDAKYSLKVIDILGKVMINENVSASEGFNTKEINLQGVSKGMYMVTLQTEGEQSETLRLIVE